MAISYTTPWSRVKDERHRQDKKFPDEQNDARAWLNILVEEVGEVARAILEKDQTQMEKEIVEVAAVAIGWLEDLEKAREHAV